jgi:hypothetical protein
MAIAGYTNDGRRILLVHSGHEDIIRAIPPRVLVPGAYAPWAQRWRSGDTHAVLHEIEAVEKFYRTIFLHVARSGHNPTTRNLVHKMNLLCDVKSIDASVQTEWPPDACETVIDVIMAWHVRSARPASALADAFDVAEHLMLKPAAFSLQKAFGRGKKRWENLLTRELAAALIAAAQALRSSEATPEEHAAYIVLCGFDTRSSFSAREACLLPYAKRAKQAYDLIIERAKRVKPLMVKDIDGDQHPALRLTEWHSLAHAGYPHLRVAKAAVMNDTGSVTHHYIMINALRGGEVSMAPIQVSYGYHVSASFGGRPAGLTLRQVIEVMETVDK